MDFSASNLMAGFIFSIIGWWVFREGKRNTNINSVIIGLLLMLYSIFTPSVFWTWVTGIALCGMAYRFRND